MWGRLVWRRDVVVPSILLGYCTLVVARKHLVEISR